MKPEIERLRDVLQALRAWDVLNPGEGRPEILSDAPWARSLIDDALRRNAIPCTCVDPAHDGHENDCKYAAEMLSTITTESITERLERLGFEPMPDYMKDAFVRPKSLPTNEDDQEMVSQIMRENMPLQRRSAVENVCTRCGKSVVGAPSVCGECLDTEVAGKTLIYGGPGEPYEPVVWADDASPFTARSGRSAARRGRKHYGPERVALYATASVSKEKT